MFYKSDKLTCSNTADHLSLFTAGVYHVKAACQNKDLHVLLVLLKPAETNKFSILSFPLYRLSMVVPEP